MRLKTVGGGLGSVGSRLGVATGDAGSVNRMRKVFEPWRKWYSTAAWVNDVTRGDPCDGLRIQTFRRDGFKCRMCSRVEGNSARLVCDHVEPHKGDRARFFDPDNLQTLCKPCHDSEKQRLERSAFR